MTPRLKWLLLALCVTALAGAGVAAPHTMRRMDSFNVKRVEVRGTRYLAPHEALRQSGITAGSSVFDDLEAWQQALERHPLVTQARVERDLPSTVRIHVTEADPVALVRAPELRPVRADGRVLPVDPAEVDLDLPVLIADPNSVRDGHIADARVIEVTRTLAAIRDAQVQLYGWISDAGAARDGGVRLTLRSPAGAQIFVPVIPDARTLRELWLTLSDLAARQDFARLAKIDARYRHQVVVALSSTAAL